MSYSYPPAAVENGSIKRIADDEVQSGVLELVGENVALNYITCPADPKKALGIKLPYFVLIIKNVGPCRSAPFGTLCVDMAILRKLPCYLSLFDACCRALCDAAAQEVLHLRDPGHGRQERQAAVPRVQLSGTSHGAAQASMIT